MSVAPPEPAHDPAGPGEDQPREPTPDMPDPAFPEVLPGGDPGPAGAPEPETQPDETG